MAEKNIAQKIADRKKLMQEPVFKRPYAPENLHISKEQFIAKRRHEKEEALEVEKFRKEFREKKIKEDKGVISDGVQGKEEEKGQEVTEVEQPKRGRPKRIEE